MEFVQQGGMFRKRSLQLQMLKPYTFLAGMIRNCSYPSCHFLGMNR